MRVLESYHLFEGSLCCAMMISDLARSYSPIPSFLAPAKEASRNAGYGINMM